MAEDTHILELGGVRLRLTLSEDGMGGHVLFVDGLGTTRVRGQSELMLELDRSEAF